MYPHDYGRRAAPQQQHQQGAGYYGAPSRDWDEVDEPQAARGFMPALEGRRFEHEHGRHAQHYEPHYEIPQYGGGDRGGPGVAGGPGGPGGWGGQPELQERHEMMDVVVPEGKRLVVDQSTGQFLFVDDHGPITVPQPVATPAPHRGGGGQQQHRDPRPLPRRPPGAGSAPGAPRRLSAEGEPGSPCSRRQPGGGGINSASGIVQGAGAGSETVVVDERTGQAFVEVQVPAGKILAERPDGQLVLIDDENPAAANDTSGTKIKGVSGSNGAPARTAQNGGAAQSASQKQAELPPSQQPPDQQSPQQHGATAATPATGPAPPPGCRRRTVVDKNGQVVMKVDVPDGKTLTESQSGEIILIDKDDKDNKAAAEQPKRQGALSQPQRGPLPARTEKIMDEATGKVLEVDIPAGKVVARGADGGLVFIDEDDDGGYEDLMNSQAEEKETEEREAAGLPPLEGRRGSRRTSVASSTGDCAVDVHNPVGRRASTRPGVRVGGVKVSLLKRRLTTVGRRGVFRKNGAGGRRRSSVNNSVAGASVSCSSLTALAQRRASAGRGGSCGTGGESDAQLETFLSEQRERHLDHQRGQVQKHQQDGKYAAPLKNSRKGKGGAASGSFEGPQEALSAFVAFGGGNDSAAEPAFKPENSPGTIPAAAAVATGKQRRRSSRGAQLPPQFVGDRGKRLAKVRFNAERNIIVPLQRQKKRRSSKSGLALKGRRGSAGSTGGGSRSGGSEGASPVRRRSKKETAVKFSNSEDQAAAAAAEEGADAAAGTSGGRGLLKPRTPHSPIGARPPPRRGSSGLSDSDEADDADKPRYSVEDTAPPSAAHSRAYRQSWQQRLIQRRLARMQEQQVKEMEAAAAAAAATGGRAEGQPAPVEQEPAAAALVGGSAPAAPTRDAGENSGPTPPQPHRHASPLQEPPASGGRPRPGDAAGRQAPMPALEARRRAFEQEVQRRRRQETPQRPSQEPMPEAPAFVRGGGSAGGGGGEVFVGAGGERIRAGEQVGVAYVEVELGPDGLPLGPVPEELIQLPEEGGFAPTSRYRPLAASRRGVDNAAVRYLSCSPVRRGVTGRRSVPAHMVGPDGVQAAPADAPRRGRGRAPPPAGGPRNLYHQHSGAHHRQQHRAEEEEQLLRMQQLRELEQLEAQWRQHQTETPPALYGGAVAPSRGSRRGSYEDMGVVPPQQQRRPRAQRPPLRQQLVVDQETGEVVAIVAPPPRAQRRLSGQALAYGPPAEPPLMVYEDVLIPGPNEYRTVVPAETAAFIPQGSHPHLVMHPSHYAAAAQPHAPAQRRPVVVPVEYADTAGYAGGYDGGYPHAARQQQFSARRAPRGPGEPMLGRTCDDGFVVVATGGELPQGFVDSDFETVGSGTPPQAHLPPATRLVAKGHIGVPMGDGTGGPLSGPPAPGWAVGDGR